ncbi:DUF4293 domain-containing protein [Chlorobium sp. N1]|uniref:DUF4293 domain-containing protein n=1 Tax=Chlorobium sp. N1 TaxID=2491138 RepID=UPI001040820D|nr:DUF4293 domain-containing protein [Chlorobium sp. N1]TCD47076.1 DUF4293 family protein [Chlorobium sp. N1]
MIARIQSLYLILAALLAAASTFFPFWSFSSAGLLMLRDFSASADAGIFFTAGSFASGIFSPLTAMASVAAIFLFRNRGLQQKVIALAVLFFALDLLSALTAAHFMNQHFVALGEPFSHRPENGFFMILPEPVLFWLAMKGVEKDNRIANAYKRL